MFDCQLSFPEILTIRSSVQTTHRYLNIHVGLDS